MRWIFLGYATSGYAVLVITTGVRLLHRWDPVTAALYLLILPAVFIPLGLVVFIHGTREQRGAVRAAIAQGVVPRSAAFWSGVVAGGLGFALCALLLRADGVDFAALLVCGLVLTVAPGAAGAWLVEHVKEAVSQGHGFSPIFHSAVTFSKSTDPPSKNL